MKLNDKLKKLDESEPFGREVGTEGFGPKQKRGFAMLDPEQRKAVAAAGGRAVKPHNRSFSQDRDLAAAAGKKGGTNGHGGGRPKKETVDD